MYVLSTISREIRSASPSELRAYLFGAASGDGTFNAAHSTTRISQKGREWPDLLVLALERLGHRAWVYREGRSRDVWVVETRSPILGSASVAPGDESAECAFMRGWFDAKGGIPRSIGARLYIQLAQKDRAVMEVIKALLHRHGIATGVIHNPSAIVDPDYWRLYVAAGSHGDFFRRVGSWHPRKRESIDARLRLREPSTGQAMLV